MAYVVQFVVRLGKEQHTHPPSFFTLGILRHLNLTEITFRKHLLQAHISSTANVSLTSTMMFPRYIFVLLLLFASHSLTRCLLASPTCSGRGTRILLSRWITLRRKTRTVPWVKASDTSLRNKASPLTQQTLEKSARKQEAVMKVTGKRSINAASSRTCCCLGDADS